MRLVKVKAITPIGERRIVNISVQKNQTIISENGIVTHNCNSLQPALRFGIEQFSKNCTFILTGNYSNKIINPLKSRCTEIDFSISKEEKKQLITQFFKRICAILDKETVEYDRASVAEFITKYYPDNRKILNELQRYSVSGKVDVGILSQVGDINLKDLIKFMKEKDFSKVREWITINLNNDYNTVYRKIYDGMYSFLKPNSIPQVVLVIAKYQYQTGFVADPEIQILACMTEIMVEAEFL